MNKQLEVSEIQASILTGTRKIRKISTMIDKLPACDTRTQLVSQLMVGLKAVNDYQLKLTEVNPGCCWYGFTTDKCPNCICELCKHGTKL